MKMQANVRFDVPVSLARSVWMPNFGGTYPKKERGVHTLSYELYCQGRTERGKLELFSFAATRWENDTKGLARHALWHHLL